MELVEGEFVVGQPVFGEETAAFGQIHAFDRADAEFIVSPISTSASNWERTTGFLDVNEQRVYDSNRFQEFSYDISSPINITEWKNPLKFAAHPAGFKVVGTQVLLQSVSKKHTDLDLVLILTQVVNLIGGQVIQILLEPHLMELHSLHQNHLLRTLVS